MSSRFASVLTLLAAAALSCLAPRSGLAAPAAAHAEAKRTVLQFESTLKDDDNKPVAGIFQMTFELRKPKQKKAFWTEKHWVALDNGRYALQLGKDTALPKDLDPKSAVMVVSIPGVGEVLQEPLAGEAALTQVEDKPTAGGKRIVQYAEKAGFAYEAERATVADRIGNFTAKLLQDTLDALDKRKVKVKIGKNHINLTSIGGAGGTPYETLCPPGTVCIGIRGGSGIYIDNFQLVCAPLE